MTNEEAIRIAQGLITDFKCKSETMIDFCNTIIKALKQESCEDCISRQAAIALAKDICVPTKDGIVYKHRCIDPDEIRELPPVTPKPKIGHWKDVESLDGALWNICSECRESQYVATNYCPNCGARMEGTDEEK